jgi:hypothetical protein
VNRSSSHQEKGGHVKSISLGSLAILESFQGAPFAGDNLWNQKGNVYMPESMLEIARRTDLFFMQASPIHDAMHRLTKAFHEMDISFAIAGAMAANAHGHKRTTADVDILIRRGDLDRFKAKYLGLGWVNKFEGSKNFRDTVCDVNVDALIVGDYRGDGLPKPIAFPEPEKVSELMEGGIPYITLKTLLELKLASGMTAPQRPRDFDDVIQLVRIHKLPLEYQQNLDPYVHHKFVELWHAAQINDDY